MRKRLKKISVLLLSACLFLPTVGCGGMSSASGSSLNYPDYGYANADSDSWKQIEDLDKTVQVTWYVDSSTLTVSNELIEIVKDKFNIAITPRKPVSDDGSELSSYIINNTLPDIITVSDYTTIVQLGQHEYVYPLQDLAAKYAPSMLERIPQDLVDFWGDANGKIYGWPANFFSNADLASLEKTGSHLMSNYGLVVREDYLEAYLSAYPSAADSAMSPSEFISMCEWVKDTYHLGDNNPTVCLENFTTDSTTEGSRAITALSEFFAVPLEDSEGNLTYRWEQEEMKEVMLFLNELYRKRLVISGNLSATAAQVGSYIQNGLPFAVVGATQNYQSYFRNLYINTLNSKDYEEPVNYVPIVITNAAGDMPVLGNIAGRGNRLTMISGNCERVDRVIKLFDWLVSEEGHRETYFGQEGETYTVEKAVGTTENITVNGESVSYTYPYGQMKWTDSAWNAYQHYNFTKLKIHTYSYLQNPLYAYLTDATGKGYGYITMANYMNYNHKAAYMPLTYNKIPFKFNLDPNHSDYTKMIALQSQLELHWIQYISRIIMAPTATEASSLYDKALQDAQKQGSESLRAFQNASFLALKSKMGLTNAWPPNVGEIPTTMPLRGDRSYELEVPANVNYESYNGGNKVYTVD